MPDQSHILGLPYIQPAQAQKHVTHNEAIRTLDVLTQLSVIDRDLTAPPVAPSPGDRYIVAASATGAWAGQDNAIAVFEDSAWAFYPPQNGWYAVIVDEGASAMWDGSAWANLSGAPDLQNLDGVGINTASDATNKLAVAADATLLTHDGTDHRIVVNKSAATDTASLVFQTNYSGRAEMGTAGTDDFAVKVSADAITWNTGLSFDAATGVASFPSGARLAKRVDMGGRWYCYADNRWVTHNAYYGVQSENMSTSGGTGTDPNLSWSNHGILIDKDSTLTKVKTAMRRNSADVTGLDIRVYFQTGPWGNGWSANGAVTRTLVASSDGETLVNGFNRFEFDLAGFVAPEDGFVLTFIRPTGTMSATRYIYSAMTLDYLTPS